MNEPIDLAGLPFLARSGNGGIVQVLGERGIRIPWRFEPSEEDRREFEAWVERKLPNWRQRLFIEGDRGLAESQRAYAEFEKDAPPS